MRRRSLIALSVLGVGAVIWFIAVIHGRRGTPLGRAETEPGPKRNSSSTPPSVTAPQIEIGSLSHEQAVAEVRSREALDRQWEWKTQIRFYGKAVDEKDAPVDGANVHLQWTNLSARGTGEADVKTDAQGRFSVENVHGKRLLVRVTKPG
jgi:hypothetical protein